MHNFAYIDETLDINLTQSYQLSIQLSLNGLSFCIYDPVQNKYIALVHQNFSYIEFNDYLNAIEKLTENDDLLKYQYKSVKVIWLSGKNNIIPSAVFSENDIKTQFEFTQKLDELDELHYQKLRYVNSVSIYTIPSQIAGILSKHFSNIRYYNQVSPFLNHIFLKHHSGLKKIFVNINTQFIDIAVVEKDKLLLYNNFQYKNDMDIVYYIMNVYNQYQNTTNTTDIILSGFTDKKAEVYLQLKQFASYVKFDKQPEDFTYSYTFNKLANHNFINLFNLNHCE